MEIYQVVILIFIVTPLIIIGFAGLVIYGLSWYWAITKKYRHQKTLPLCGEHKTQLYYGGTDNKQIICDDCSAGLTKKWEIM